MINIRTLDKKLKEIGCQSLFWGRSELYELAKVIMPGEEIAQVTNGYYEGGFGQLCVTNYRVLLIDKKPLALTLEDLRYDMIAEVDYGDSIFTSNLHIITPTRTFNFYSWSRGRLRKCMSYIQDRVMEMRNQGLLAEQFQMPPSRPRHTRKLAAPLLRRMVQHIPGTMLSSMEHLGLEQEAEHMAFVAIPRPTRLINPYHKAPLLARRRRYPSFY